MLKRSQVNGPLSPTADYTDPIDDLSLCRPWKRCCEPFDLGATMHQASGELVGVELRSTRARVADVAPIKNENPQR